VKRQLFSQAIVSSEKNENGGGFNDKIVHIFALINILAPTLQYRIYSNKGRPLISAPLELALHLRQKS